MTPGGPLTSRPGRGQGEGGRNRRSFNYFLSVLLYGLTLFSSEDAFLLSPSLISSRRTNNLKRTFQALARGRWPFFSLRVLILPTSPVWCGRCWRGVRLCGGDVGQQGQGEGT